MQLPTVGETIPCAWAGETESIELKVNINTSFLSCVLVADVTSCFKFMPHWLPNSYILQPGIVSRMNPSSLSCSRHGTYFSPARGTRLRPVEIPQGKDWDEISCCWAQGAGIRDDQGSPETFSCGPHTASSGGPAWASKSSCVLFYSAPIALLIQRSFFPIVPKLPEEVVLNIQAFFFVWVVK